MSWWSRLMFAPRLIIAPLLMAAAPPPVPCEQPSHGDQVPAALDLSGRPVPRTPLISSALTTIDGAASCGIAPDPGSGAPGSGAPGSGAPGSGAPGSGALHDPRADALHALPVPDVTQVIPTETGN